MFIPSFVKRNTENSDFVWIKHQKAASNSILTSTTRPLDNSIFNFGIIIGLMSRKNFFWIEDKNRFWHIYTKLHSMNYLLSGLSK